MGEIDAHFRLKDELAAIRDRYPHIVIDCPPTLGLLTVNALVAATHLLIPIQSSYFALEGTDDLLETIEKVRARPNPALQILGVRDHDARQADVAGAGHPGADPEGVRRQGLQDRDHQERAARGEPGLQGVDLHLRARLDAARPSTTACARRSSTVPKRGLPDTIRMRHDEHYVEALAASAGTPIGRLIPIDQIDPNPNQPRQVMGDLSELMASIAEKGIIEPLIVRQRGERFQIIAGERRYQAAVQVGPARAARSSSATSTTPRCIETRADREPPAQGPDAVRGGRGAARRSPSAAATRTRTWRRRLGKSRTVDHRVAVAERHARRRQEPLSAGRHFL